MNPSTTVVIPDRLDDWTYDTVAAVVQAHEYEPGWFDYKGVLNATGTDQQGHRQSICRTACSMANTDGGFILFGVKDRKVQVLSPSDRLVGIPLGDHRKELANKLEVIEPPIHFEATNAPLLLQRDTTRAIFVVHIPHSPYRPHMYDGAFPRRGAGGSVELMNVYEVREQMLNTEERLRKATLLQLELKAFQRQLEHLSRATGIHTRGLVRFDVSTFKLLLADICPLLPDDLLADLVQIPVLASMVNEQLNQLLASSERPRQAGDTSNPFNNLDSLLTDLHNLCWPCEPRLAAIFGPLSSMLLPQQTQLLR